jgi:hypothetical protein
MQSGEKLLKSQMHPPAKSNTIQFDFKFPPRSQFPHMMIKISVVYITKLDMQMRAPNIFKHSSLAIEKTNATEIKISK